MIFSKPRMNDQGMPHLVDIVANIIDVWSLIVSYLEETGRKYDGDSLEVKSSSFCCVNTISDPFFLFLWCSEEGDGQLILFESARPP